MSICRSICKNGVVEAEVLGMRSAERRKVNVLEMKCLRNWLECHDLIELGIKKRCIEELK